MKSRLGVIASLFFAFGAGVAVPAPLDGSEGVRAPAWSVPEPQTCLAPDEDAAPILLAAQDEPGLGIKSKKPGCVRHPCIHEGCICFCCGSLMDCRHCKWGSAGATLPGRSRLGDGGTTDSTTPGRPGTPRSGPFEILLPAPAPTRPAPQVPAPAAERPRHAIEAKEEAVLPERTVPGRLIIVPKAGSADAAK